MTILMKHFNSTFMWNNLYFIISQNEILEFCGILAFTTPGSEVVNNAFVINSALQW